MDRDERHGYSLRTVEDIWGHLETFEDLPPELSLMVGKQRKSTMVEVDTVTLDGYPMPRWLGLD